MQKESVLVWPLFCTCLNASCHNIKNICHSHITVQWHQGGLCSVQVELKKYVEFKVVRKLKPLVMDLPPHEQVLSLISKHKMNLIYEWISKLVFLSGMSLNLVDQFNNLAFGRCFSHHPLLFEDTWPCAAIEARPWAALTSKWCV